jgi:aarF domain-containing kinase
MQAYSALICAVSGIMWIVLASASIAQVHRVTLKSGERVLIKVQKPNIDKSLKADLSFIYAASCVLEFVQPDFECTSLSAIAGDSKSSMLEELDFEKEATNLEEFRIFLHENTIQCNTIQLI